MCNYIIYNIARNAGLLAATPFDADGRAYIRSVNVNPVTGFHDKFLLYRRLHPYKKGCDMRMARLLLTSMHNSHIAHRDVNKQNIMRDRHSQAVLIDFADVLIADDAAIAKDNQQWNDILVQDLVKYTV